MFASLVDNYMGEAFFMSSGTVSMKSFDIEAPIWLYAFSGIPISLHLVFSDNFFLKKS